MSDLGIEDEATSGQFSEGKCWLSFHKLERRFFGFIQGFEWSTLRGI